MAGGERLAGEIPPQPASAQVELYRQQYEQLESSLEGFITPYKDRGLTDELLHGSTLSFKTVVHDLTATVHCIPQNDRGYEVKTANAMHYKSNLCAMLSSPEYEKRIEDNDDRRYALRVMSRALEILGDEHVEFNGLTLCKPRDG